VASEEKPSEQVSQPEKDQNHDRDDRSHQPHHVEQL
jgi:hypothetical protein